MHPELKEIFMQILSGNAENIQKIEVKSNPMGKRGSQMIAFLLVLLSNLKELSLIDNKIGLLSAETIFEKIDYIRDLVTLILQIANWEILSLKCCKIMD